MKLQQKITFTILCALAFLAMLIFFVYWFNSDRLPNNFGGYYHIIDFFLFAIVTYVIWLPIIMKVALWSISSHIKSLKFVAPAPGLRVALITTFVPGTESIELLDKTLPALKQVQYEHDTWLLDEGDSPEVKELCKKYKVNHFTRYGIDYYNTPKGKFAEKTKGGNHNSWYDRVGNNYDIVAQMDTDFIPKDNFLLKTLGYFKDRRVAFVGTPQIYGNTNESLIARGAAQQTFSFYGPLLRGMAGMNSSMLIGANHVIRVSALKVVDHYSAHITEDLLTGMKLHSRGWKSVYVPEALAVGEGPTTWKSYFAQQKRWAYGCMHILFTHSFKLFKSMTLRQKIYYFVIQQHYFGGLAMFLSILCLSFYFIFGLQPIAMEMSFYLGLYFSLMITIFFIDIWLQQFNVRPKEERGVMWAGMYMGIVAWPIYLNAFFSLFKSRKLVYKVTPKGKKISKQNFPVKLFAPHIFLAVIVLVLFISSYFTLYDSTIMRFWALTCGVFLILVPIIPSVSTSLKRILAK